MRAILVLGAALAMSACATVTKGTEDTVKLESNPPGAAVSFKEMTGRINQTGCTTPCKIELNRKYTYAVEIAKEGYETWVGRLEPKMSGDGAAGMAGNVLIGGVIGAAIDASTGAMNDLKPNPMIADLVPVAVAAEEEAAPAVTAEAGTDVGAQITETADTVAEAVEDGVEGAAEAVGEALN